MRNKETDKTARTFLNEKPTRILLAVRNLENPCPESISRASKTSYNRTLDLLHELTNQGILSETFSGKKKVFSLTPMGEALAENFSAIDEKLKKWPGFNGERTGLTGKGF